MYVFKQNKYQYPYRTLWNKTSYMVGTVMLQTKADDCWYQALKDVDEEGLCCCQNIREMERILGYFKTIKIGPKITINPAIKLYKSWSSKLQIVDSKRAVHTGFITRKYVKWHGSVRKKLHIHMPEQVKKGKK